MKKRERQRYSQVGFIRSARKVSQAGISEYDALEVQVSAKILERGALGETTFEPIG